MSKNRIRQILLFNLQARFCALAGLVLIIGNGHWNQVNAATNCPLCPAIGAQTISEEIDEMDVAIIAKLVKPAPKELEDSDENESDTENDSVLPLAKFRCVQVIKGDEFIKTEQLIDVDYRGDAKVGSTFMISGVDPPELAFNNPILLSETAKAYVDQVARLGFDPVDRLVFYQRHLDSQDELISQDAYDEFARAPYEDVIAMKSKMNHDQIIKWIESDKIPSSRRRLFFMMLGVCGKDSDLPMLEKMLREADPKERTGIDSIIACYLTLAGEKGLPLITELFFRNKKAEYTDTYSAVMAIRFHGTEGGVIETEKLLPLLHHLLDRPRLADLVIPDLARWEDWTVRKRLIEMFKESDGKNSWVRVPIINYLKACPLPEATLDIEELKKIDPNAFRRSNQLFPFGDGDGEES